MNIERMAELDKAATPGPWSWDQDKEPPTSIGIRSAAGDVAAIEWPLPLNTADGELIVALRNAAPELLAVVEIARRAEGSILDRTLRDALREALRALDATGGGE